MERCHSSGCHSPVPESSIRQRTGGAAVAGPSIYLQTEHDLADASNMAVLHSPRHPQASPADAETLSNFYRNLQDNIVRSESDSTAGHFGGTAVSQGADTQTPFDHAGVSICGEDDPKYFSTVFLSPRPDVPWRSDASTGMGTPQSAPEEMESKPARSLHIPRINLFPSKKASQRILKKEPLPPRAWSPIQLPRMVNASSCRSSASTMYSLSSSSTLSVLPDKFTRKWPQPRPARDESGKFDLSLLEEEALGIGIERVGRWTPHKWCLLFSIITVFIYGLIGMTYAISTWFRTWLHADVMYVADYDILVLITLASSILLLTSILGLTGTLLNSRPILALYALLLWPAFISMLSIGYTGYKRQALSLDRKLNLAWSQWYTPIGRLIIQDSLQCCGYYNALHEATPSKRCYSRTSLPGCKSKLFHFEQTNLGVVWSTIFSLIPLHIFNIFVALLCANHVTKRFGKGITPKGYRLTRVDIGLGSEKLTLPQLSRGPSTIVFREDRRGRT